MKVYVPRKPFSRHPQINSTGNFVDFYPQLRTGELTFFYFLIK